MKSGRIAVGLLMVLLWVGAAATARTIGFGFHTIGDSGNGNWGWAGDTTKNYINSGESAGATGLEQVNWFNTTDIGYDGDYYYSFTDSVGASTVSVHLAINGGGSYACTGSRSSQFGYGLPDPLTAQAKLLNGMAWLYDTTMTITLPASYQTSGYDMYLIGSGDYTVQLGSGSPSSFSTGASETTPAIVTVVTRGRSSTVTLTGFNGGGKYPGEYPNKLFSGFQIVQPVVNGTLVIVR